MPLEVPERQGRSAFFGRGGSNLFERGGFRGGFSGGFRGNMNALPSVELSEIPGEINELLVGGRGVLDNEMFFGRGAFRGGRGAFRGARGGFGARFTGVELSEGSVEGSEQFFGRRGGRGEFRGGRGGGRGGFMFGY